MKGKTGCYGISSQNVLLIWNLSLCDFTWTLFPIHYYQCGMMFCSKHRSRSRSRDHSHKKHKHQKNRESSSDSSSKESASSSDGYERSNSESSSHHGQKSLEKKHKHKKHHSKSKKEHQRRCDDWMFRENAGNCWKMQTCSFPRSCVEWYTWHVMRRSHSCHLYSSLQLLLNMRSRKSDRGCLPYRFISCSELYCCNTYLWHCRSLICQRS